MILMSRIEAVQIKRACAQLYIYSPHLSSDVTTNTERRGNAKRGTDPSCLRGAQFVHVNVTGNLIMASFLKQLASKRKDASVRGKSAPCQLDSDCGLNEEKEEGADQDRLDSLTAQPQSPSPEAEYDKLLVSGRNCFKFCILLGSIRLSPFLNL